LKKRRHADELKKQSADKNYFFQTTPFQGLGEISSIQLLKDSISLLIAVASLDDLKTSHRKTISL
jgi:hypothetical protein